MENGKWKMENIFRSPSIFHCHCEARQGRGNPFPLPGVRILRLRFAPLRMTPVYLTFSIFHFPFSIILTWRLYKWLTE